MANEGSVEQDVAQALCASTLWSPLLVYGTDVKYGPKRSPDEPGNATPRFWVRKYDERRAPMLNTGTAGSRVFARVQVEVYSPPDSRDQGLADGVNVVDALHTKHAALNAITTWATYYSAVLVNGPHELDVDEKGAFSWTVNLEIEYVWAN